MKQLVSNLKGDKGFGHLLLLALFSLCFSASSNLAYIGQGRKYIRLFGENIVHICGFTIIFMVHKVPYHYFKAISKGALYIVWIYWPTPIKGTAGLLVPVVGFKFHL
jgi:cell division protein FtsW